MGNDPCQGLGAALLNVVPIREEKKVLAVAAVYN
jgi:hypothetical protein